MRKSRKRAYPRYSEAQTTKWLSWLARGMQKNGETVFLVEKLQPSWLLTCMQRWIYILSTRLIVGLLFGLIMSVGLIHFTMFLTVGMTEIGGIPDWLSFGLFLGLLLSITDAFRFKYSNLWSRVIGIRSIWIVLLYTLIMILISGLMSFLIDSFCFYGLSLTGLFLELIYFPIWTVLTGLILGLVFGVMWGMRYTHRNLGNDIITVETLTWSWSRFRRGCLISFVLIGLVSWLVLSLLISGSTTSSLLEWAGGIGFWSGIVVGVFRGHKPGILEMKTVPNQGMRRSILSAIYGAVRVGLIFGLPFVPFFMQGGVPRELIGLISLLVLIAGLWYGGLDVIQHYTLRFILYLKGYTPFNYVRFLDYAAEELNFLQKVGGGYIFIHRYLLEHFAAMKEPIKQGDYSKPTEKQA